MNRLIIVGAGGHGKVVADIARLNGYEDIVFLDSKEGKACGGYPIVGSDKEIDELDGDLFIAIGNSEVRKTFMQNRTERYFPTLIHPAAVIAKDVMLGEGSVVMAGAVINSGAIVGRGCIINTSCSVDHDCVIGDFCHISVGSHLAGTVNIGEGTWIGIGAIISNNVCVCSNCTVGAGAVIVRDLCESGTYIGIPARMMLK